MNIETIYEGKIGVNNLSPQHPLDVSGSVNITGNLSVDTNTLFVDASNNKVGVGTITPEYQLEIVDQQNRGNTARITGYGNNILTPLLLRKARGTPSAPQAVLAGDLLGGILAGGYKGDDFSANVGMMMVRAETDFSNNLVPTYLSFDTTPTTQTTRLERMRITSSGNVGIGTTTPSSTLDVSGTGNVTGNFTVDTNTLFVDASNNRVGVCTINTNPFSKLTVNSDDSTAAISINRYNKDGPAYLYFRATDGSEGIPTSVTGGRTIGNINFAAYDGTKFIGSVAAVAAYVDSGSVGSTNMPGNLRFYTRPINDVSDTNAALNTFERMRILSNGNVGIGTTTPSSTLDVS
jgi:hypothetical protein